PHFRDLHNGLRFDCRVWLGGRFGCCDGPASRKSFAVGANRGYPRYVLRRVISAVVLASLAAAPVVARTRFVCRYTGIEITDCAEQQVPSTPELRTEGCCDRQLTPAASAMLTPSHEEIQ